MTGGAADQGTRVGKPQHKNWLLHQMIGDPGAAKYR